MNVVNFALRAFSRHHRVNCAQSHTKGLFINRQESISARQVLIWNLLGKNMLYFCLLEITSDNPIKESILRF